MEEPGCEKRQHDAFVAEMVCFRLIVIRQARRRIPCLDGK